MAEFTPLEAAAHEAKQLPVPPPSKLIGLDITLGRIYAQLKESKAVLVTGPAGIGKSALAATLASAYAERPGGVLYLVCDSDTFSELIVRVGRALRITEAQGLPGQHHFYITFETTHPGVSIANSLKALHPNEMTIVLQHQYWNLHVHDDRFEVELSFDNVPEHLVVPFEAVKGFLDPAVQFGLQFDNQAPGARPREVEAAKPAPAKQEAPSAEQPEPETKTPDEAAKIVSLDRFRKK